MVDFNSVRLSVRQQCQILSVNRSTLYYKPQNVSDAKDTSLSNDIHQLWLEMPFYGYRRITHELRRQDHDINEKKVLRLMREMNIQALYPKPRTTIRDTGHKLYPYLLKGLEVTAPNQVWATDITYLKLSSGFGYLVALIDVYSRYIIAWRVSNTMDTFFCLEMLEEALAYGSPEILNTDQGSQFTSKDWITRVEEAGVKVSMDGKGRWVDNVIIERFWRSLKHEHFLLHSFDNLAKVRQSLKEYIALYNHRRLHQSLGYKTPADVHGISLVGGRHPEKPHFSKPAGYVDNFEGKLPTYPQAPQQQLDQPINL
ncbi:MAG: IS3 family transposase [Alphaproteobacteria bacterium]|jgi:putative transposase|nr:IS3 family transposase [Alphaproteobacteria bacterium]